MRSQIKIKNVFANLFLVKRVINYEGLLHLIICENLIFQRVNKQVITEECVDRPLEIENFPGKQFFIHFSFSSRSQIKLAIKLQGIIYGQF